MKKLFTILTFLGISNIFFLSIKSNAQMIVNDPVAHLRLAEQIANLQEQISKIRELYKVGKNTFDLTKLSYDERSVISSIFSNYHAIDRILKDMSKITSTSTINAEFGPLLRSKEVSQETKQQLNKFLKQFEDKNKELVNEMQIATNVNTKNKIKVSDYERRMLIEKVDEDLLKLNKNKDEILKQATFEKDLAKNIDEKIERNLKFIDKQTIKKFFTGQDRIMYDAAKTMIGYIKYIAAIGFLCSVVIYAYRNLKLTGEPLVIETFTWPLFVTIFLFGYEPIMHIIDNILLVPINEATANLPGGLKEIVTTIGEYNKSAYRATVSESGIFKSIMSLGVSDIISGINSYIAYHISAILVSIVSIVALLISLICNVFISVYIFFGPIAIAMSVIPGFKSSLTEWLSGFIKLSLCMPVANIILSIFGTYVKTVLGVHNPEEIGLYGYMASAIYMIISIVVVVVAPMLTRGIVARGADAFSAISNSMAGRMATGALTKGASTAAGNLKREIADAAEGSKLGRIQRSLSNKR